MNTLIINIPERIDIIERGREPINELIGSWAVAVWVTTWVVTESDDVDTVLVWVEVGVVSVVGGGGGGGGVLTTTNIVVVLVWLSSS